jgi:hypothetical protein
MLGVLREELQMHSAGGAEERMIRASLRGLKGSAQEQANVKALLNLFALVPEDTTGRCSHTTHILIYIYTPRTYQVAYSVVYTSVPLELLLLIFEAVNEGGNTSIMHLRKYLPLLGHSAPRTVSGPDYTFSVRNHYDCEMFLGPQITFLGS